MTRWASMTGCGSSRRQGPSADGRARSVVKGWIAIGDVAYGVFFSAGGFAVGGIALGGISVGVLSVGGVCLGAFALGGIAIGRIALGGAWRMIVAGEMLASQSGIGSILIESRYQFRATDLMMAMILISIVGYVTERLIVGTLEKKTTERWEVKVL